MLAAMTDPSVLTMDPSVLALNANAQANIQTNGNQTHLLAADATSLESGQCVSDASAIAHLGQVAFKQVVTQVIAPRFTIELDGNAVEGQTVANGFIEKSPSSTLCCELRCAVILLDWQLSRRGKRKALSSKKRQMRNPFADTRRKATLRHVVCAAHEANKAI